MKKYLAFVLVLVMALSLAACGGGGSPEVTVIPTETIVSPEQPANDQKDNGNDPNDLIDPDTREDMNAESYMNYIFETASAETGDTSFSVSAQNAAVRMSSDNARDYIIEYDSGLVHLYTAPLGYVRMVYGAIKNDDTAPYFLAAIIYSLEDGITFSSALESVEELMTSDSSTIRLDDILLQASEVGEYIMVICTDIEAYTTDTFYEKRMDDNVDVGIFISGIGVS